MEILFHTFYPGEWNLVINFTYKWKVLYWFFSRNLVLSICFYGVLRHYPLRLACIILIFIKVQTHIQQRWIDGANGMPKMFTGNVRDRYFAQQSDYDWLQAVKYEQNWHKIYQLVKIICCTCLINSHVFSWYVHLHHTDVVY